MQFVIREGEKSKSFKNLNQYFYAEMLKHNLELDEQIQFLIKSGIPIEEIEVCCEPLKKPYVRLKQN